MLSISYLVPKYNPNRIIDVSFLSQIVNTVQF